MLARERDIALVLARMMPFEHGEGLTDRECPQGILEHDDSVLVQRKLGNIGMLFELKVEPKVRRKWCN